MTKENVETIAMICRYATSKERAIKAFSSSYPEIPIKEIEKEVEKKWLTVQAEKHSLAGMPIKQKILTIRNLLSMKELKALKKIYVPIVKEIRKKLPLDIYKLIIKETSNAREKERGMYLELLSMSDDGIKMTLTNGAREFIFTIHDVNCARRLILV